ncbi:MAG: FG-GAP-like repeat-containing protein, partial [Tannerella sp.]|jgi:uncharacterized repeat protein (TIGR02543 family)/uncharacterized repeat protein (TIGR01451 family)|nr:FG-GAP-like repeat-containing protein [Tannerella sp.]
VRPYNAFLQQQTLLSSRGVPLRLAPFGEIVRRPIVRYYAEDDSLSITLVITNSGDAFFQAPLYVTTYKKIGEPGNEIATDSIMSPVNVGDTITFAIPVRNFSAHLPLTDIEIRLNDKGNATLVQAECNPLTFSGKFLSSGLLIANNDRVNLFTNHSIEVDILANDTIPASCSGPVIEITGGPAHGTASLTNGTIHYTPSSDYTGRDTLTYRLACNGDTATALLKILVNSIPDNMNNGDCRYTSPPSGSIGTLERKAVSSVEVYWLATPFVGDLDGDSRSEVVVPGKMVETVHGRASAILIFDDALKLKKTITLPSPLMMPAYNTMTFLIADTDNDGLGEIVFCTADKRVRCYGYDKATAAWSQRWMSNSVYGGGVDTCASLIVADINGDGYAEILASDKIFAGESGKELVTLPAGGRGFSLGSPASYMPVFADVDNDGIQEVVAGRTVYKITITNRNGTTGNAATVLAQAPAGLPDGFTAVSDNDMDGDPDVIVTGGYGNNRAVMYVWDGATSAQIGNTVTVTSNGNSISRASVGDINGDKSPEIAFTYVNMLVAYRYNPTTGSFGSPVINLKVSDPSGATAISLFDFDQNGKMEMVYRDNGTLYIIENGVLKTSNPCSSDTHTEYPVIVDLDRDGHADILVSGKVSGNIRIIRYGPVRSGSGTGNWAPARKVWNQYSYNSIHITDRLRVPAFPPNPAAVFPGPDGQLNTADDVRPYNNFLQQQTFLDFNGVVYWPKQDLVPIEQGSFLAVDGSGMVIVRVFMYNKGYMPIGAPVHATFYNEYVSSATKLGTGSYNNVMNPGDTAYIEFAFSDSIPIAKIVARVNDDGRGNTPWWVYDECSHDNNELSLVNMKKDASIGSVSSNGTYGNPASVLYGDVIQYKITAYNASQKTGTVIIRDTLPAYLNYIDRSAQPSSAVSAEKTNAYGAPKRDVLRWDLNGIASGKDTIVSYKATPEGGACASQPLFINRAWITSDNTIVTSTNSTYHQGAGVSTIVFSTGYGGSVYNAQPQILDYKTSARVGVLAVPDEGYAFAGWSHDDYYSLRGERIPARSDIIYYDTLIVFGDVELTANFKLIDYPIHYYLNGGENAGNNPDTYTIQSGDITLEEPCKSGDVFIGWTGSNGTELQKTVTIPKGSTCELEFYANYLYSGCEEELQTKTDPDKIWGEDDELFIRTSKTGSIVRIYSLEGVLTGLHTILSAGVTKIKLQRGIYIVTLNNGFVHKVIIK